MCLLGRLCNSYRGTVPAKEDCLRSLISLQHQFQHKLWQASSQTSPVEAQKSSSLTNLSPLNMLDRVCDYLEASHNIPTTFQI